MLAKTNAYLREANLIGGEWVAADSGATFDVTNPANGQRIGNVPDAGGAETRRAIDAAHEAFLTFRKTTANERAKILRDMAAVMMDNQTALAELLTGEMGKPLAEAMGEIAIGANYLIWFAEEGRRVYGDLVPSPWADRRVMVRREPVGVVAAITPWNFPSSMLARKIGPAIAAGCTSVIKPAEATPYSGLAWGVIAEEAGLPAGCMNIVTGDAASIGEEMCANKLVRKITFTGSTRVGKLLMKQATDTVKKVSMELGGNAPFLVFDSADVDKAVEGAIAAKFRNSGQTCVCTNRFYVQDGIHDEFVRKFSEAASAMKVGDGMDDGVQQGPLINEAALDKVETLLADALEKGAEVATGGEKLGGTFMQPTVLTGATKDMRFATEEIFGPVAPVFRFKDEQEAIDAANDTDYGLAGYAYTSDLGQAFRVMEGLEYGLVGVNEGVITTPEAPFGGYKESGVGSEGGRQGIEEYLQTKYVCVGGLGL
ncbi:MAG: NAD-dependent succinate-semialdehyde dehydrogenase [Pseudomonadota bacterium]